jgi:hypothetical protein
MEERAPPLDKVFGVSGAVGSSSPVVLVNGPSEHIESTDLAGIRMALPRPWCREQKSAVRASPVVMIDVFGEHGREVATRVDEEMVEAFLTNGSHPAFGERTGLRIASIPIAANT